MIVTTGELIQKCVMCGKTVKRESMSKNGYLFYDEKCNACIKQKKHKSKRIKRVRSNIKGKYSSQITRALNNQIAEIKKSNRQDGKK